MLPIRLKPAPPDVPTAQFGQLVGYKCVASRDIGASKALLSCCFASPLQHNGGGAQALRLGPLPMSYQCDAIASLTALAAADALAGAGSTLRRSATISRTRTLRMLAAATATRAAVGAAALAGVQRAIAVLGAAARAARTRRVRGRS